MCAWLAWEQRRRHLQPCRTTLPSRVRAGTLRLPRRQGALEGHGMRPAQQDRIQSEAGCCRSHKGIMARRLSSSSARPSPLQRWSVLMRESAPPTSAKTSFRRSRYHVRLLLTIACGWERNGTKCTTQKGRRSLRFARRAPSASPGRFRPTPVRAACNLHLADPLRHAILQPLAGSGDTRVPHGGAACAALTGGAPQLGGVPRQGRGSRGGLKRIHQGKRSPCR